MVNEYMWSVIKNETHENADHRKAVMERKAEAYRKRQEHIRDNPESLDVMNGDALNSKLKELLAPTVSDSASRYARVSLDADIVRRIPFKLAERGQTISMYRLSPKRKWVVAFQDSSFATYRRKYQLAVDNALELAIAGKMEAEAIQDVEKAIQEIEDKLKRTTHFLEPKDQVLYSDAKKQLDQLHASARFFKDIKVQRALKEIDTCAEMTVDDLRLFMQRHNLTFAPADSPDERTLYRQLYTALLEQRKKATGVE